AAQREPLGEHVGPREPLRVLEGQQVVDGDHERPVAKARESGGDRAVGDLDARTPRGAGQPGRPPRELARQPPRDPAVQERCLAPLLREADAVGPRAPGGAHAAPGAGPASGLVLRDRARRAHRPRRSITAYKNALLRRYSHRLYLTHNFISSPATFFRADALRAVRGFDERYRISVDYDVQLKLARRGDPIVLDRDLAAFRMTAGTL